jgi:hypothetical protein
VANDRVRPAPIPRDIQEGIILAPRVEPKSHEEVAEYVIDRLVEHGKSPDDEIVVRVRWAGYSDEDEMCEKAEDLPSELCALPGGRAWVKDSLLLLRLFDLAVAFFSLLSSSKSPSSGDISKYERPTMAYSKAALQVSPIEISCGSALRRSNRN